MSGLDRSKARPWSVATARTWTDTAGAEHTAWTRIGTAWQTRDGGFRIVFDALPVSGQCVVFPPDDKGQG